MDRLIKVQKKEDIFSDCQNTPVGLLLEYHNLNRELDDYDTAQLLIGMCMDNRNQLRLPANFAFIIRAGGGNLRYSEFKVSYAVAIGGINTIVLIAHNDCGMVNLFSKKEQFIEGLVNNAGWNRDWAEEHFVNFSPMYEIGNEVDFVLSESKRLRLRYPKIMVIPLFYNTQDHLLYQIREE
ncbi:MAG: carbonic anhydrase [Gracilibacter sp. BRH_c7a]|nr:MAG: carbonic anhydrase [Gracilibacter sp. BRH_c7a]